ncbi:MAG: alpha-amylase, partial [Onishia taeanensis]
MSSSLPPTPPRQLDEAGFVNAARARLEEVYGPRSEAIMRRLVTLISHQRGAIDATPRPLWSERDQWLITYG